MFEGHVNQKQSVEFHQQTRGHYLRLVHCLIAVFVGLIAVFWSTSETKGSPSTFPAGKWHLAHAILRVVSRCESVSSLCSRRDSILEIMVWQEEMSHLSLFRVARILLSISRLSWEENLFRFFVFDEWCDDSRECERLR